MSSSEENKEEHYKWEGSYSNAPADYKAPEKKRGCTNQNRS